MRLIVPAMSQDIESGIVDRCPDIVCAEHGMEQIVVRKLAFNRDVAQTIACQRRRQNVPDGDVKLYQSG
jgi:hypothetical protein